METTKNKLAPNIKLFFNNFIPIKRKSRLIQMLKWLSKLSNNYKNKRKYNNLKV